MHSLQIKLADDTISKSEIELLAAWLLEERQLTKGPLTRQFEEQFAEYIGTRYSIMVNSGSSANLLMAYGLQEARYLRNKKVIVPAVSWITTLSPFMQLGFECFLCDSDPDDLGLDLNHLEDLLKKESPSLVILVHILGHPNRIAEIHELCERYDCRVIEDACEALGTKYRGKMVGNLSLAGSFSFYYGHHISTIEGGAVTTSDSKLYDVMLSIRSHGWSRDVPVATKKQWREEFQIDEFREFYSFYFPGFNFRSSDLNAFLGLGQMKRLAEIVQSRARNFDQYRSLLQGFWHQKSEYDVLSSFAYGTFVANRLQVFQHLKKQGIECRPLVCGSMGRQPFWTKRYGEIRLPMADRVHDLGLYLPNHARLTPEQIEQVAREFTKVAEPVAG